MGAELLQGQAFEGRRYFFCCLMNASPMTAVNAWLIAVAKLLVVQVYCTPHQLFGTPIMDGSAQRCGNVLQRYETTVFAFP